MKTRRPVVLAFVAVYLPGHKSGGPVRTIANMVAHLGREFDFRIVTADRDALDVEPYPGIILDGWNDVGDAKVFYMTPSMRSTMTFARLIRETPHDILYLNSFFDPTFSLKPLIARKLWRASRKPAVVAPRGEFSKGALAIKSWKKKPYILASRLSHLHRRVIWQASSGYEKEDIRRIMAPTACTIRVAPDLPAPVPQVGFARIKAREAAKPLRICFLSRISPMKNLDFALRVLMQVKVQVEFDIYGPVRDEPYWTLCKTLIEKLPQNVTTHWHGSVTPPEVPAIMAGHDLFFLPTLGENYGHVIAEALSVGTPVLIADTTPWRNLETVGAGWDLPLSSEADFARRIEACAQLDESAYDDLRSRAHAYAEARLADPALTEANRRLFLDAINGN